MFRKSLFFLSIIFSLTAANQEIIDQLSSRLKSVPQERPVLILIGGFPGSGKTLLTQEIAKTYETVLISFDSIRQLFKDREISFGWTEVKEVYQELFRKSLHCHYNIVMDTNSHSAKIEEIERLLQQEKADYLLVKICLNPPFEALLSRVQSREQIPGLHQGTESDLRKSFRSMTVDTHNYDLVIDTSITPFAEEWAQVNALLESCAIPKRIQSKKPE